MRKVFLGVSLIAALAWAGCTNDTTPEPVERSSVPTQSYGAYMLVMGKDYQAKDLGAYAASLPPIYAKYGGEYVAFSTDMSVLEGAYDYQSLIISGWPSVEAAQAFWTSPEYIQAKALRDGIGTFDVIAVPALAFGQ